MGPMEIASSVHLLGDERSPRHLDRLLGVDDEVHEHLMQLVLVRHNRWQVGRIGTRDLDAGAPQAVGQDLDAAVENRPDIDRLDLPGFLPGQGEEAPDDPGTALGGRPQPGQRVPDSRIFTPLLEHDGAPEHDRERIVQFMRHAGQERAERRQLLALVHRRALPVGFGLGPFPVADVEDEAGDVGESALFVADRKADDQTPDIVGKVGDVLLVDDRGAGPENLPVIAPDHRRVSSGAKTSSGVRPMISDTGRFWTLSISGLATT